MNVKSTDQFRLYPVRLMPRQDLKKTLMLFAEENNLYAAAIISAVGSLSLATLRLANASSSTHIPGPLEIVSLSGTLSRSGCHLHASVANSEGQVLGGHILEGCSVYTTCEIVILEDLTKIWHRETDPSTGYLELKILERNAADTTKPTDK